MRKATPKKIIARMGPVARVWSITFGDIVGDTVGWIVGIIVNMFKLFKVCKMTIEISASDNAEFSAIFMLWFHSCF